MPENKITQSTLDDFIATVNEKPALADSEAFKYFPEFGNDKKLLDAAWAYKATIDSRKYKTRDEINSKFPEFFGKSIVTPPAPKVTPQQTNVFEKLGDFLGYIPSNLFTPVVESIVSYFDPEFKGAKTGTRSLSEIINAPLTDKFSESVSIKDKGNDNKIDQKIKQEQQADRTPTGSSSTLQETLDKNKQLYDYFKREIAFDLDKRGVEYDENVLNQETLKKLSNLGYKEETYSLEEPIPVFKQNAPNLNPKELEKMREKAAQLYTEKIEELKSDIGPIANFIGEGNIWDITKKVLGPATIEIDQKRNVIKDLEEEKKKIDQEYKSAISFQTNKYTASKDGVSKGFLSTQMTPDQAILNPDLATRVIMNSQNELFAEDLVSQAKATKEGEDAFKKSLVEKSVFLNNEFTENALVELKAMEEGKKNIDILPSLFLDGENYKQRYERGYSTLDFEYHLAQQLKREKQPIIQSINQDKLYKDFFDKTIQAYIDNKKVGKYITIGEKKLDEEWFKSAMQASQALDASIAKKESDLMYYEELEAKDTKQIKQFEEQQKVFNETGDKSRFVFSVIDATKDLARSGERIYELLYLIAQDDEETVTFRGRELKREDIEATKINKPLREIDQYYELISKIGEPTDQRIKAVEAEAVRLFDESGNFSPDVDLAALGASSVKVGGQSLMLGTAGFGGQALSKALVGALPFRQTAARATIGSVLSAGAKATLEKTGTLTLGYVLPSNLLLGSESIKRYMEKGYNFDQSFSLSAIDNTIEGLTEAISPNDALIVKNMILKGEIKTAQELAENEIYKGAFKKAYKVWTGKNLSDKLYNTFKAYGPSLKKGLSVLAEETGEEITGEGLRSLAYKAGLTKENPILDEPGNFTLTNIANVAISTMATMALTGLKATTQDFDQRQITRNQYQYLVGQNSQPYVAATLQLFAEGQITEEETKRRLKSITDFETLYNKSVFNAIKSQDYASLTPEARETLKQKNFLLEAKKKEFEDRFLEAPTDEEKQKILNLLDRTNDDINDLKFGLYKSEAERVERVSGTVDYFINDKTVKSYSDTRSLNYLISKYQEYKKRESNKELIKVYNNALTLLNKRKNEVIQEEKESKKAIEQKAAESEVKGFVKIKDKSKKESDYEIGKKYISNRQVAFGEKNPVRFPEITFRGYKKNEAGEIQKDENGSPIVIFDTVNTKGEKVRLEKPASYFENYKLEVQENLNSSFAGRFYNKFKGKKFTLSLKKNDGTANFIYEMLAKKGIDLSGIDVVNGYLSVQTRGKTTDVYFNFINPNTGKENYLKLSDKMIFFANKASGFLKPAPRTYTTKMGEVTKIGQYEDLTLEEMEEMGFFTEKELEEYRNYLQNEDFSDLMNERLLEEKERREFLQKYIIKISERLTKNVEKITKLTSEIAEYKELIPVLETLKPFLNFAKLQKINVDDLKKVLPKTKFAQYEKIKSPYERLIFLKNEIEGRLNKYSEKVVSASENLAKLEEENKILKPLIDAEITAIEELSPEELDFTTSLVPQVQKKIESLKEAIQTNNQIIADSRNSISILEKALTSLKEAIAGLLSSLQQYLNPEGFIEQEAELSSQISKTIGEINNFNYTIAELEGKNEEIEQKLKTFTKLKNYLQKLEKELDEKTNALTKEKIKKFLYAQQEPASNVSAPSPIDEKEAEKIEKENQQLEEESAKKYFETLFETSTSFGYNYSEELKDPNNNYANARLDFFFNSFEGPFTDFYLIPINKKNAEKFGLTGILFKSEIDTDVKLVVARKVKKDEYVFVDMNGKDIQPNEDGKYSPDQVIYTSLQKATLTTSKGDLKYNINDPAFSDLKAKYPKEEDYIREVQKIAEQQRKIYEEHRNAIVANENPSPLKINFISRGIPQYTEKKADGQYQRNPIPGTLIAEDAPLEKTIVIADVAEKDNPKLGKIAYGPRTIRVPLGRPVIVKDDKNEKKVFQFADNHKLSKNQRETLLAIFVQMTKEILDNYQKSKEDPTVTEIVPLKYTKFLSGILYWRNPTDNRNNQKQDPETIKNNQVWLDFTDGEATLHIGKTNKVSLKSLLKGTIVLEAFGEEVYHNVYSRFFGKKFEEFYLENGKIKSRTWDTYEEYLLSEKYPDGTLRPVEEIPLTTSLIPNDSPFDENGKFNENYNPQYRSRYFIFTDAEYQKKKAPIKKTEQKQPEAAPAPKGPSTISSEIKKKVDDFINDIILQSSTEELKQINKQKWEKFKSFVANLKEGVTYKINLTSKKTIEENNGEPLLVSFSVKFDKNGNISLESFNDNSKKSLIDFLKEVSNPDFEISKTEIEGFFNFLAYNKSSHEGFHLLQTFANLEITEEPILNNASALEEEMNEADKAYLEMQEARGEESEFFDAAAEFGIPEEEVERKEEVTPEVTPKTKEEEPTEKKEEAPKTAPKGRGRANKPKDPTRLAIGEATIKENLKKAKEFFYKILPDSLSFEVVKGLIDGVAWGKFVQNGVILSEAAEVGTVYHEAFEVVAGLFLNRRQWNDLVREFRSRNGSFVDRETGKLVQYSKATDHQAKEELAEEYRDYQLSNGKSRKDGQYKANSLFRRIYNYIKHLIFGDPKNIEDLFRKISAAEYKDAVPVKWNRPFNVQKSYRIANLEDGLFYYQANKSLRLYFFRNLYEKDNTFERLFNLTNQEGIEIYKEIKNKLNEEYFYVKDDDGVYFPINSFEAYDEFKTLDDILSNYDKFFSIVLEDYKNGYELPSVFQSILAYYYKEEDPAKSVAFAKNKLKDALLAFQYINSNWESLVESNKNYLKKFQIEFEGDITEVVPDEEGDEDSPTGQSEEQDEEEEKGDDTKLVSRDEAYVKDPFISFLSNTANKKVKILIATLPVSVLRFEDGEYKSIDKPNDLGLPEAADFPKTFRKVVSTVIEETNILTQLQAIKDAIPQNPEFYVLYKRLGGEKTINELINKKDLWNLRNAFNASFNKQRVGFSRVIARLEEKRIGKNKIFTLLTNVIDSLQSNSYRQIEKRYLSRFKDLIQEKERQGINWKDDKGNYIIPSDFVTPSLSKDLDIALEESVYEINKLGFDTPYDITLLTEDQKEELFKIVESIISFISSPKQVAKLENLKTFNFSKHVAELAKFEYSITKDANETQHRNLDGMAQSNDISQNSVSIVYKLLNKATNLDAFERDLPRFNDIFTKNALWRKIYFNKQNKNRKKGIKLSVDSAEGMVMIGRKGKHTSRLEYGDRILQEFLYNIMGDSKNFRTPGFYFVTPADIKTEFVVKWGKALVESSMIEEDLSKVFDDVFKGYLIDEIMLARELSVDDRGLDEYRKIIETPAGERTVAKSLRMFNDILTFDYTDIIDNPEMSVEDWIAENKTGILKDIKSYFDQEIQDTFDLFLQEQIIQLEDPTTKTYNFMGMETQLLEHIDSEFGTNMKRVFKATGKVLISENDLKKIIRYRSINYFVNINEQSKLFFGDIGQFGDLSKRVKSFVSTRETTITDTPNTNGEVYTGVAKELMNKVVYTDENGITEEFDLTEEIPGYQSFDSEFKASTISDVKVVQRSLPYLEEVQRDSIANDIFFANYETLPEDIKKIIDETVKELVSPFEKVEEADGQAWMALPLYRQFLHRSQRWDDDLQELYDYHMAYERNKRNQYSKYQNGEKLRRIDNSILEKGNPNEKRILEGKDPVVYPVLKPIGAGVRPGNKFITTLDKCSICPLHYQLLEGKPALDMYISAIDNDVQYFRMKSAHKVGAPAERQNAYNEKGLPNDVVQTDTLSFLDFAIQVETGGIKDKVTRGTQLLKLAIMNLMESSVPVDYIKTFYKNFQDQIDSIRQKLLDSKNYDDYLTDWKNLRDQIIAQAKNAWDRLNEKEKIATSPIYKLVNDHNKVLTALTYKYFDKFSEEFSIASLPFGGFQISDYSKFKEAIHKQLKDRDAANNLLAQLEIENGKFIQPFDFVIGADKLEPIIMAILNKNVTKPSIKGKSLAQIASTFFDSGERTWVEKKENKDGTFSYEKVENPKSTKGLYLTSSDLIFYGDYYVEENGVTRHATEKEIEEGKAKVANFIEVLIPPIFKDTQGNYITDIKKIDPEILKSMAYRTPTQEMSSIENIRIKGFLPLEYQNGIVVPSSITAKAGSDFDIDKLTMYLYHYIFSAKDNKLEKISYLDNTNSTPEQRYIEYVKEFLFKNEELLEDDELAESYKVEVFKEMMKNFTKIVREKFANLPVFQESNEQFKTLIKAIKKYPNEKDRQTLLDTAYDKASTFDKYEAIVETIDYLKQQELSPKTKEKLDKIDIEISNLLYLDDKTKSILEALKRSSKKTKGYSLMKGAMKQKERELLANYVYIYGISLPELPTYSEFLNFSIDQQNTIKALENKYIDTLISLITLPENRSRLTVPNSAEKLKALAEKMESLKKDVKKESVRSHETKKYAKYGSANYNGYTRFANIIGKLGIGIAALGMTNHATNQWLNTTIEDPSINEISLILPANALNDSVTISFKRDANGKWISDNITQFINAFVDIAKDPFIIKLNGDSTTAGAYLFMNKIGIPLEYSVLVMNQPIVEMHQKLSKKTQSVVGSARLRSNDETSVSFINKRIEYVYGKLSDDYESRMFSIEELEDMISNQNNLTDEQKQDQLKLLQVYLQIKEYSDALRQAISTVNYEVDILKTITDVFSKRETNYKYLQNDPKIVIDPKFTYFLTLENIVNDYAEAISSLFLSFAPKYVQYISPIIRNVSEIKDKNSRENALADIKKGFANYLLLTIPYSNQNATEDLLNGNNILQNKLTSLMINYETSVYKKLKDIQLMMERGEIPTNFALQELFPLSKDDNKGTFNITVFNKSKDPEYIDLMVNSLKELAQSSNSKISQTAREIYDMVLLQSGLNQSSISISQYFPADSFLNYINSIFASLNSIERGVLDYHMKKFKSRYYANKWKDPKFTTTYKYSYKKTELSKNPIILKNAAVYEENGELRLKYPSLAEFQLVKYVAESDQEGRDFVTYKPKLFQRVEFENGDPIMVPDKNGYAFVYKQVTPLGEGQYSLEYSSTSQFNDNVDEDSNETIIANIVDSGKEYTSWGELEKEAIAKITTNLTKPKTDLQEPCDGGASI